MYTSPTINHSRPRVPALYQYLGEDETAYYVVDELGFFKKIGKMFSRAVKITPKSFRPGNIFKAVTNVALTTATAGGYQFLPSKVKKSIENIGKIAVPIIGGGILAAVAGPAVISVLGPKLAMAGSILGKSASSIGSRVFGFMSNLGPAQQAQVAEQITPQQIAQIEQTGNVPPDLTALFNQLQRQSIMPPAPPPLYAMPPPPVSPEGEPGAPVAEAGMLGGMGPGVMVFLGLSVVAFVVMGAPGPKRR